MRKTLTIDGINISITVQDLPDTPHLKQYSSRKYDIWCHDENWDVAQEDLAWILKDKVKCYTSTPYSEMPDKREREKWKTYHKLLDMGLNID